jgi:hypothetical protein
MALRLRAGLKWILAGKCARVLRAFLRAIFFAVAASRFNRAARACTSGEPARLRALEPQVPMIALSIVEVSLGSLINRS